jgi:hypothetical protein
VCHFQSVCLLGAADVVQLLVPGCR